MQKFTCLLAAVVTSPADGIASVPGGGHEALRMIGALFVALAGAFTGAWLAFRNQNRREKNLKADKEYAAIIRAQHSLMFMWRTLARTRHLLAPFSANPKRHLLMPPLLSDDRSHDIDFDSLGFLFRSQMPDALIKCFYAENSYRSAQNWIAKRNASFEEINSKRGPVAETYPGTTFVRFEKPIDAFSDLALKSQTDGVYNTIDAALALGRDAFTNLRRCALEIFPDRHFMADDELTSAASQKELDDNRAVFNAQFPPPQPQPAATPTAAPPSPSNAPGKTPNPNPPSPSVNQ